MFLKHCARIAGLVGVGLSAALPAQTPTPIDPPLGSVLPDLVQQSSWAQDARYEGDQPNKRLRGVYPIGNGQVFGYCGLGSRANTLQAITGPGYQTDDVFAPKGHFGELTLELHQNGKPVDLPIQRVRRVRGAGFVVTEDAAPGGVALRTLTFATPDQHFLTRIVEVVNLGAQVEGLVLHAKPEGPTTVAGTCLVKGYASKQRPRSATCCLTSGQPVDGTLTTNLGVLATNARWGGVLTISMHTGLTPKAEWVPAAAELEAATADARKTLAWWRNRLAPTAYFDTDHRKINDLVQDWKVMILVQRDAHSGAVAPMVNYRGAWVRDSNGPMLLFLRFNMWDEARTLLRYFFKATCLLGEVANHVPLDLDFSSLKPVPDWNAVAVPDSEVSSWVIQQHFWYWRVTQDHALIREHWPMLEACLKKQKRGQDSLMTFHGDETWLHGAFYSLYPDRVGEGCQLIADDAGRDRRSHSLASATQFLIAMQAIGEMQNGLDRAERPEAWKDGIPKDAPGQRYNDRGFAFMGDIERRYWLNDVEYFAPAVSPVTGEPHTTPFADVNLSLLWIGWTFPSGEKSRLNLKNSLARLWRRGARVGMTPTVGWSTGLTQAQLLLAFSERDAKERFACLDEVLRLAEPAGEWGELYDPEGRPAAAYAAEWPNRCRPWESGVNLDAIIYAICGIRFNTVPNWDNSDIRVKLRMPPGATYVTMKDIKKDGRHLHLFMDVIEKLLTDAERGDNEKKKPEDRRDPNVPHRRLHFRLELLSDPPPRGYYDVGVNALNTMFVRYFWKEQRVIDEMEFWHEDQDPFFPADVPGPLKAPAPKRMTEGADLLVLTARKAGAEIAGTRGVTVVDTGLPSTAAELADLLVDAQGQPRHKVLYLDWGWNEPGRATFKTPAFWQQPAWQSAVVAFKAAGGRVVEPGYLQHWENTGKSGNVSVTDGRVAAPAGAVLRTRVTAAAASDAVLRLGSNSGYTVLWNGTEVASRQGRRHPTPDQDAHLVRLVEGENVLEIRVPADQEAELYARITEERGLPVPGIQ